MASRKPSIRLHYGAAHNDIIVDGKTFIRNHLTPREFSYIRHVIKEVLFPSEVVGG